MSIFLTQNTVLEGKWNDGDWNHFQNQVFSQTQRRWFVGLYQGGPKRLIERLFMLETNNIVGSVSLNLNNLRLHDLTLLVQKSDINAGSLFHWHYANKHTFQTSTSRLLKVCESGVSIGLWLWMLLMPPSFKTAKKAAEWPCVFLPNSAVTTDTRRTPRYRSKLQLEF